MATLADNSPLTTPICDPKIIKTYELNDCAAKMLQSYVLDDIRATERDIADFKGEAGLSWTSDWRKSELNALIGAAQNRLDRLNGLFKTLGGSHCASRC